MHRKCPACGADDRQEQVCQLWDRPQVIYHCLACDRFYAAPALCDALESLSEQELTLLKLTAAGCLNKQISSEMGVSLRTVAIRRRSAMAKLGVKSRAELIRKAIELGIAE